MLRVRLAFALACSWLAFVAVPVHATCGAEGCPLVRDAMHAGASRFSFDVRYQEVVQNQLWNGTSETQLADVIADADLHGEVELYTRTRSWVAEGRARLLPSLQLVASLPYLQREHRHWLRHTPIFNEAFLDRWKYEGVGDATLLAQARVLHRPGLPVVTLQGGAKLPTGRTHVPDEAKDNFGFESTLEPAARPGTGSTDWVAGALVAQSLPSAKLLPVTASVLARWTGKGTDDYKVGNELQLGLAGGVVPHERLTLLAQFNYAQHDSDVSAEASEAAHSAMRSLYASPGLSVQMTPQLSLYAVYQARLWAKSDEATVIAGSHLVVGTNFRFVN